MVESKSGQQNGRNTFSRSSQQARPQFFTFEKAESANLVGDYVGYNRNTGIRHLLHSFYYFVLKNALTDAKNRQWNHPFHSVKASLIYAKKSENKFIDANEGNNV